jgi:hypothetical protein
VPGYGGVNCSQVTDLAEISNPLSLPGTGGVASKISISIGHYAVPADINFALADLNIALSPSTMLRINSRRV